MYKNTLLLNKPARRHIHIWLIALNRGCFTLKSFIDQRKVYMSIQRQRAPLRVYIRTPRWRIPPCVEPSGIGRWARIWRRRGTPEYCPTPTGTRCTYTDAGRLSGGFCWRRRQSHGRSDKWRSETLGRLERRSYWDTWRWISWCACVSLQSCKTTNTVLNALFAKNLSWIFILRGFFHQILSQSHIHSKSCLVRLDWLCGNKNLFIDSCKILEKWKQEIGYFTSYLYTKYCI